jgi:hypothetical protein
VAIVFDKVNRIMTVEAPATEVTIQDLINTIRDWEDNPENMEVAKTADASGKEDLGGGLAVGITLKLLNWKLKFQDRTGPDWADCSVTGGNLVAVDANNVPMNPIAPAAYVTVTVVKAVSAALIAEWSQSQIDSHIAESGAIKAKTDLIPSDIADIPTMTELNAAHGSGTWEGATPTQVWENPTRSLTTMDVAGSANEHISKEETLSEIKGPGWTDESLKKIFDKINDGVKASPGSVAQYLERQTNP